MRKEAQRTLQAGGALRFCLQDLAFFFQFAHHSGIPSVKRFSFSTVLGIAPEVPQSLWANGRP